MKQLQETLTSKISEKMDTVKELKKNGNEKRAFKLFEEVQELKKQKANITAFKKI